MNSAAWTCFPMIKISVVAILCMTLFSLFSCDSSSDSQLLVQLSTPENEMSDIYIMKLKRPGHDESSERINLTNSNFMDQEPIWSPDRSKIAFVSERDNEPARIYVMNSNGSLQTKLTYGNQKNADFSPSWSPDGTKIYFEREKLGILSIDSDGTNPKLLAEEGWWPEVNPTGTKIVFARKFDLFIMNSNGTMETKLTDTENLAESQPTWSPDGTKIAFVAETLEGSQSVAVINADGTKMVFITSFQHDPIFDPTWYPDGEKIMFVSRTIPTIEFPTASGLGLHTIRTENGDKTTQVTFGRELIFSPDW